MEDASIEIYLCPRCLIAGGTPGVCKHCGQELITCQPGSCEDPQRRPLIDRQGNVRSRAPIWWLKHTLGSLILHYEEKRARD